MKLVYISNSIIPSRTANSIHVMKMCQAFAKNGHEVILIAPDFQTGREKGVGDPFSFYGVIDNFKILFLPWYPIFGQGFVYGIMAGHLAKRKNADVVYGRDFLGCFFAVIFNLPVIFESHSPIPNNFFRKIFSNFINKKNFINLVVITHALKEYYLSQYPALQEKIIVAADGADPVVENKQGSPLLNDGKKIQVGYVGHLYPGRGIELIEQLAKRCPWADFHIVGGTKEDIDACKLRIGSISNLTLHGYKPPKEAGQYLLEFDILLSPYQKTVAVSGGSGDTVQWMSPLKIFEYMATGKTIVCSDIPVLREILIHNHNALLCEPDSIDTWEKALLSLSRDEKLLKQLGKNAQNDFIKKYTWQSRAETVLRTLEK